jgi:hypothetical protein
VVTGAVPSLFWPIIFSRSKKETICFFTGKQYVNKREISIHQSATTGRTNNAAGGRFYVVEHGNDCANFSRRIRPASNQYYGVIPPCLHVQVR